MFSSFSSHRHHKSLKCVLVEMCVQCVYMKTNCQTKPFTIFKNFYLSKVIYYAKFRCLGFKTYIVGCRHEHSSMKGNSLKETAAMQQIQVSIA